MFNLFIGRHQLWGDHQKKLSHMESNSNIIGEDLIGLKA
jgi:hypothetical protein